MAKRGKKAAKPVKLIPKKAAPKAQGKKRGKPKNDLEKMRHTVTVVSRDQPSGMVVAPEPEPFDLGPLDIPEGPDAERVLRELAILNDRVLGAHKAMKDAQATAKAKKDKWDDLSEELQTKLRQWTHKSDLPLFDRVEREQDQAKMEAGPEQPQESTESTQDETSGIGEAQEPAVVSDALTESAADEQIPF